MGPTVAAEGCSPPQELVKAGRRAAIFLVFMKIVVWFYIIFIASISCDLFGAMKTRSAPPPAETTETLDKLN